MLSGSVVIAGDGELRKAGNIICQISSLAGDLIVDDDRHMLIVLPRKPLIEGITYWLSIAHVAWGAQNFVANFYHVAVVGMADIVGQDWHAWLVARPSEPAEASGTRFVLNQLVFLTELEIELLDGYRP
ncbi:MAG: hypothetical protein MAG451_02278 [Anaerolineales bacterium]|nr:hypothetical protein [Anaerolineales bacterium]